MFGFISDIFTGVFGDSIKEWFFNLSILKMLLIIVPIIALVSFSFYYTSKHPYVEYNDKIERYYDSGNRLICKNGKNREILDNSGEWNGFSNLTNFDKGIDFNYWDCKRLDENNNIIPNHLFTKVDEKSWTEEFWDSEDTLVGNIFLAYETAREEDNLLHINDYPAKFDQNQVFECQEEKISKELGWSIETICGKKYFKKNQNQYLLLTCDLDENSPW